MAGQNDPNTKDKHTNQPADDKNDTASGVSGSSSSAGSGTATGRSKENQGSTGTEIQNPGTSRQEEDVTGDPTERTSDSQSSTHEPVRNPSGDDLGNAADGDEGSGTNI